MGKHSASNLLALADIFEHRVKCLTSDRYWALSVLAEDSANDITITGIGSSSFGHQIISLIKRSPKAQEWKDWEIANSTVLGDFIKLYWEYYDQGLSHAQFPNGDDAFLSLHQKMPDIFEPKSQSLLRSSGPIPNLWVNVGVMEYGRPRASVPADIAHENWFVEAIRQLGLTYRDSDESFKVIKEFVQKYKDKIKRIRSAFAQLPKYLGGGADGVAFDIGEGKVLKIFRDEHSYQKASHAFERLHNNPNIARTEAMIYDIGELGDFPNKYDAEQSTKLYYYIIEKMTPVREHGERLGDNIRPLLHGIVEEISKSRDSKWQALKQKVNIPAESMLIKTEVDKESARISDLLRRNKSANVKFIESALPDLNPTWLKGYVEEVIMKYLTSRTDLHMGNLGVTPYGQLRYYDPAYSDWVSEING